MNESADLFRHVSAEKALFYRAIMDVFAAAKRQYRLQLRPDEVLAEARLGEAAPRIEDANAALAQVAPGARLRYHGDFDWPGLHIANRVMRDCAARPWRLGAADCRAAVGGVAVAGPVGMSCQPTHRARVCPATVAAEAAGAVATMAPSKSQEIDR